MKYLFAILFLLSSVAYAQEDGALPPMMAGFKIGTMTVSVFRIDSSKKKVPVKNQEVAIVAFQNGQQMLMLHKPTNEKGEVFFSRIIKDPTFTFALGVLDGEAPYVMGGLQMDEKLDHIDVDFQIGEGSPYALPPDQAFHAENVSNGSLGEMPASQVSSNLTVAKESSYQKVALILCALVVVVAFVFSLRQKA